MLPRAAADTVIMTVMMNPVRPPPPQSVTAGLAYTGRQTGPGRNIYFGKLYN